MSERIISHAAILDLRHFEDPAFYDRLERAQRQTTGRIGLLTQLLSVAQDSLTLISLAAAVSIYSPWLLMLLVIAVIPGFLTVGISAGGNQLFQIHKDESIWRSTGVPCSGNSCPGWRMLDNNSESKTVSASN